MDIPEQLKTALSTADEGYFIGLSNKGTVNRAKKDLQKEPPEMVSAGDSVTVNIGGETCVICAPLGDSKCSCPSSSMCRHRIGAMLWLRERVGKSEEKSPEFPSLRAYPTDKLTKQLGSKRVSAIFVRQESGDGPQMEEGLVITVELPWHPARVRLLEPVEHSTCSCHSRSFCNHRAEALLFWQLKEGIAKADTLQTDMDIPDAERLRGICAAVREMLEGQLVTGLSRIPDSVCDTVERMAAFSHTAGLADLERALRRLHGEYAAFSARSATFREDALLSYLSYAYRLALATETAPESELPSFLGTFREEYDRVGSRKLYLLGWREHLGRGGYSGTIYYFYETERREYYTFSDLRPTFYDKPRGRSQAAPWELPCTLKQAFGSLLELQGAKVNAAGNLSSTRACKATLLGQRNPWEVGLDVATDFEALLPRSAPHLPETRRLALVRPRRRVVHRFDRVEQVFAMSVFDKENRDISIEVRYRKEEARLIRHLEKQMAEGTQNGVFLLSLYREGDRLKGYPIEYFADWREGLGDHS